MSATLTGPSAAASSGSPSAASGGWWERHRGALLIGAAVVVSLLVAVLLGGDGRSGERLDPDNPGSAGGQAVARVLEDQGIRVEVVRDAAALDQALDAGDPGGTTVLVTSSDRLGTSTTQRLLDALSGARLVLTEPTGATLETAGLDIESLPTPMPEPVEARCTDTGLAPLDDLSVQVDVAEAYSTSTGCFPLDSGSALAPAGPDRMLLGAGGLLENDQVLRADNAAVALRLLGQDERLVWYVPSLEDLRGEDGVTLGSLLPPWLVPAVWSAGLALLGLALWRGRRLGALAVEPLPVAVRAVETTEGRGRLYHRSGDRAHAAAVLRAHARDRAARSLRLSGVDDEALVRAVADHLDRPHAEVDRLLGPDAAPPTDDAALVHLASELAALETEVRRS